MSVNNPLRLPSQPIDYEKLGPEFIARHRASLDKNGRRDFDINYHTWQAAKALGQEIKPVIIP